MKRFVLLCLFLIPIVFFIGCSMSYDVVVVNDSDESLEIYYKINEKAVFKNLSVKSLENWKTENSIEDYWTKRETWQNLSETEYQTNLEKHERIVKLAPRRVIQIETGNYNPVRESFGDLTGIVELKIISPNGEISYKGKLLLNQFEKNGYTFSKTYKNNLKIEHSK